MSYHVTVSPATRFLDIVEEGEGDKEGTSGEGDSLDMAFRAQSPSPVV